MFRVLFFTLVALLTGQVVNADAAVLRGHITDLNGLGLPGIVVTLVGDAGDARLLTAVTDATGEYVIAAPAGRYTLAAELSGFNRVEKRDVVVGTADTSVDLQMAPASFQDTVTVHAEPAPSVLGSLQPNAASTISRAVIDSAMLRSSRYEDVLTLMPNVVRGPDDRISVAGAPAATGGLVVNGVDETDPAGGEPAVVVPIEAINSVAVHAGGYPADIGRATGGVTSIETRAGGDHFHMSLDSMFPRLLFEHGSVDGIEYWEPNVGVSGPIIKGRLFFDQAISYRRDRNRFTTVTGPERNLYNQPLSWSQIDANLSSSQRLRVAFGLTEQHTDHANITAFTPAATVPALAEDGWSATISDQLVLGRRMTFDLTASELETETTIDPNNRAPLYALTHQVAQGTYFDQQSRRARRGEASATFTVGLGAGNDLKVGASLDRASLDIDDHAGPVAYYRLNGTLDRRVEFLPQGQSPGADMTEASAFVQESLKPVPWLTLDAGVRYDRVGGIDAALSPRLAWTMKANGDRTTVSGSVGMFADKFLLTTLAFPVLPSRVVTVFDAAGLEPIETLHYVNVIDGPLRLPRAERWDLGLDRSFASGWVLHERYQERRGRDEAIVEPVDDGQSGEMTLSSRGHSHSRSLENTVGYRGSSGNEVYASYVRSSARGDLNRFDAIEGIFKEPFVQPNQVGVLPANVPNRLLVWGLIRLPRQLTVAPFLDIRDGFPYSPIDDNWTFVGTRNGVRMPYFGSLDISATRVVDLPKRLPHARVGLKLYNLVSVNTQREVQRDVQSPDYATRYDPVSRDFAFVCVFLVGHHRQ